MVCRIAVPWPVQLPNGSQRQARGALWRAVPSQTPVYLRSAGVPTLTLANPISASTSGDGDDLLDLPWPSETALNPGLLWQLVAPDFTIFQGIVPENTGGPLTVEDLVTLHGWGLLSGGVTATTPTIVGPPNTAFIQGQALFPGYTGTPETIVTTFEPGGSITTAYERMGLLVTTTFAGDGSIVDLFSAPISRTRTTTFTGAGITEATV
jgi:hypothetical protein